MAKSDGLDDEPTVSVLPCAEKMAFDTQQEANAAGIAAEWQHGGALHSYRCRHCQLWHLSSD